MLEALTRQWGFEPVMADDGEAAWQIFQSDDAPGLLLLDWEMPNLTGYELCQRIYKHEHLNPPYIILLTSRNQTSDMVNGLSAGANDYIAKPFKSEELQARLQVGRRVVELQAEHELAEQALRRFQKMEAIGQLTGGIAHDFNNILGIILGNLELLELDLPDDEKIKKRISNITKSAERAAALTNQLLGFARHRITQTEEVDVKHVIHAMESLIARSVTPQVEVEYHMPDDLWLAEIDQGDFADALLNLLLNARDAMNGSGRLIIRAVNKTLDSKYCEANPGAIPGDYIELSIRDNGEGMAPDQLEHIFEPFFTTKELGKGTGLGLAMVFGFIRRSKGYIKVSSEKGIGTTFWLYLPRGEKVTQTEEEKVEQKQAIPHGQETILVVDDEEGLRELAEESLKDLGYRVVGASNGEQALEALKKEPQIDLLFSDVVMPGMNGYELAERVVASSPQLKVLLTSGYTEKAIGNTGNGRFDNNLLSKPYTNTELAQRVRAVLGE